jgi:ribosomal protein S18 acetylase RimI-like enzyme
MKLDGSKNQLLETINLVEFRTLSSELQHQFKQLHADLLPVRYREKFYRELLILNDQVALVAVLDRSSDYSNISDKSENQREQPLKTVVGFATGKIAEYENCCRRCSGYIMTLGTSSDYRGRGIGGRLLDSLLLRLNEMGAVDITLHCTTKNEPAIALYVSRGFTLVQKLENHYHFHEKYHDAFLFSLVGASTCKNWWVASLFRRICCKR